ncbi:hypothetical protein [Mycolicibacterium sp.]|uniref:hypothetical protein n=1 Tax=Mycolicibacterium sp. TaxID=2320850 RepID=UPI001A1B063A|nr:hypothetical protein [Mycolicibacterium sp.]MBJ7340388.1 hypothetical protein [Mycolicibacterium sp.]
MQKRRIAVIGSAAVCLLLGGAGAVAAAHPWSGSIPQSPAVTDAPDVPGQPDVPEPGDIPDAPIPAPPG